MQPFDKALKCGCFGNVKKFQGSLGKKWGHAKRVQKSDILTTRGFQKCRIGLSKILQKFILKPMSDAKNVLNFSGNDFLIRILKFLLKTILIFTNS